MKSNGFNNLQHVFLQLVSEVLHRFHQTLPDLSRREFQNPKNIPVREMYICNRCVKLTSPVARHIHAAAKMSN